MRLVALNCPPFFTGTRQCGTHHVGAATSSINNTTGGVQRQTAISREQTDLETNKEPKPRKRKSSRNIVFFGRPTPATSTQDSGYVFGAIEFLKDATFIDSIDLTTPLVQISYTKQKKVYKKKSSRGVHVRSHASKAYCHMAQAWRMRQIFRYRLA